MAEVLGNTAGGYGLLAAFRMLYVVCCIVVLPTTPKNKVLYEDEHGEQ